MNIGCAVFPVGVSIDDNRSLMSLLGGKLQFMSENTQSTSSAGTGDESGAKPTAKVMVIDDSNTIRMTAQTILKKEGYEVFTATNGFEAMSVITDTRPDIIFVDIMMPLSLIHI